MSIGSSQRSFHDSQLSVLKREPRTLGWQNLILKPQAQSQQNERANGSEKFEAGKLRRELHSVGSIRLPTLLSCLRVQKWGDVVSGREREGESFNDMRAGFQVSRLRFVLCLCVKSNFSSPTELMNLEGCPTTSSVTSDSRSNSSDQIPIKNKGKVTIREAEAELAAQCLVT